MLLPVFAYLAARDFNARDGKYIPAFAGLGECDKRINITLADSREVGAGVVDTVLGSLAWQQLAVRYGGDQRSPLGPTWEDLSSLLAGQTSLHGVVGPGRSSQSMEIAPLTGALDILQLSYWAASPHLDQKRDFPRFGRTITPGQPWGEAVVELWVELNLTHAAVLFINDAYGRGYLEAVLNATRKHNWNSATEAQLTVKFFAFDAESDDKASDPPLSTRHLVPHHTTHVPHPPCPFQILQAVGDVKKWEPTNNTGCAEGEGRYRERKDGCSVNNILFIGFGQQVEAFYKEALRQGALAGTRKPAVRNMTASQPHLTSQACLWTACRRSCFSAMGS